MSGTVQKNPFHWWLLVISSFTLPRSVRKDLQVKVVYDSPVAAPLKAGDQKSEQLRVTIPERGVEKIPLVAAKDIATAGPIERISNSIYYLFWGKHRS
jgi:D-alanyl-D-alanine carboxypeptidase (penicillin-binding protein 5/6)